jgi:integrator complex subunit 11
MQLIKQCEPKNVVLVHGEKAKMEFLQEKIKKELPSIRKCYFPANGTIVTVDTNMAIPVDVSVPLLKQHLHARRALLQRASAMSEGGTVQPTSLLPDPLKVRPMAALPIQGVLVMEPNRPIRLVDPAESIRGSRLANHQLEFRLLKRFDEAVVARVAEGRGLIPLTGRSNVDLRFYALGLVYDAMTAMASGDEGGLVERVTREPSSISVRSMTVALPSTVEGDARHALEISWNYRDEDFANAVMELVDRVLTGVVKKKGF